MEVLILDTALEAVDIKDTFESLIWTDRYFKHGDFEIYTPPDVKSLITLQNDYYLWTKDSDHVMIVEGRQIISDPETGNHLVVTGRSLESILYRRIVWGQTILSGNFQNEIERLLNENVISPAIVERKIDSFVFETSTDPAITALTIDDQFNGEYVYDVIQTLCELNSIGFKVTLTDENLFVFKLYSGVDRSYDQIANPYVIFSPNFDNLVDGNYIESGKGLKTVSLVAGEGEGASRKMAVAEAASGGGTGLARREMFTDASGISSTIDGGVLTNEEYTAQLIQRGVSDLSSNVFIQSFEGQVETTQMFKYGKDFFIGDVVQIANEYGAESKSRVIEVVRSQNLSGTGVYPTFSKIE